MGLKEEIIRFYELLPNATAEEVRIAVGRRDTKSFWNSLHFAQITLGKKSRSCRNTLSQKWMQDKQYYSS